MNKHREGYLTIELMVALGILLVGLLGIIKVSSDSMGLSRVLSGQLVANYLAAEGIEVTKNNIDAGVLAGNPWGWFQPQGTMCYEIQYNTMDMREARSFSCGNSIADGSGLRRILFNESSGAYQYEAGVPSPYKRVVRVTRNPGERDVNEIMVDSVVFFDIRGMSFRIHLVDHFFNRW